MTDSDTLTALGVNVRPKYTCPPLQDHGVHPLWTELCALKQENARLLSVIRDVHSQNADDLCWMDIDRIFAAAGLPVPDRTVGDQAAMLKNCERFIGVMCQGGHWKSYRELEERIAELTSQLATERSLKEAYFAEANALRKRIGKAVCPEEQTWNG